MKFEANFSSKMSIEKEELLALLNSSTFYSIKFRIKDPLSWKITSNNILRDFLFLIAFYSVEIAFYSVEIINIPVMKKWYQASRGLWGKFYEIWNL